MKLTPAKNWVLLAAAGKEAKKKDGKCRGNWKRKGRKGDDMEVVKGTCEGRGRKGG